MTERVERIKSSLLVKPDEGGHPVDVKQVEKIVLDHGIPVDSINVSSTGVTYVNLPDKSNRDELIPLLESEDAFNEVVSLKSKQPTISLRGVTKKLTPQDIKDGMYKQNSQIKTLVDNGSRISVVLIKPPRDEQEYFQVAVRVSPEIRKAIKNNGDKVHIGLRRYKVVDRFYIKRCNRCQQFHHYADGCDNPEICGYCTLHHKSSECPDRRKHHSEHHCINCRVAELESQGHPTFWSKCPAYVEQQNKLKNTISYNYLN